MKLFLEIEQERQNGRLLENVIDLLKYENVDYYGKFFFNFPIGILYESY